jgi:hypothetical protein
LCGFHGLPSSLDQEWNLTLLCGPRVSRHTGQSSGTLFALL